MAETFDPHCVWFVGAGPGDRELITLKGYRLLQQAQVVIYAGSLINTELLEYCPPQAECHDSAELHLEQILDLMEAGVKAGKRWCACRRGRLAVRLGARAGRRADPPRDPLAGGAGRQRLPRRGGGAGVEYTVPEVSQSLIITRLEGRTPVPRANSWRPLPATRPRWRFTCPCSVFTGWRSG
jgi:precorrin-4/cobalt-precorrin-4 C11-methyltransferase